MQPRTHKIAGAGGLPLHVVEYGAEDAPPVLLLHGWAQSHVAWFRQQALADEFRLVCPDLRGHGSSGKPAEDDAGMAESRIWGDDIAAIIDTLALKKPLLVGWSYGGVVACDYIAAHGAGNLSGLAFVGASVISGARGELFGDPLKKAARAMCAPDAKAMIEATIEFMRRVAVRPVSTEIIRHMRLQSKRDEDVLAILTNAAMMTPVHVRRAVMRRKVDHFPLLKSLKLPTLVVTGAMDRIVLPAMAEEIAAHVEGATLLRYEGVGHAPFLEEAQRFNRDLAVFAKGLRR